MNKIILLLILIVLCSCYDNNKSSSLIHKSMMFLNNHNSEKQVKNNNEKRFDNNSDLNELVNLYDKPNLSNLSSTETSFYDFIVKQLNKKESLVTIKRLSNEGNQSRYVYSVENSNYLITLNILVNSLFIDSYIIDYKLETINKNNNSKNISFSGDGADDNNDLITLLIIEFNKVWNKQTGKVHDNESKMKSFLKNEQD
jgi:lipoprotein